MPQFSVALKLVKVHAQNGKKEANYQFKVAAP